jgi:tetratricopeptide (TPR) repeat protein
MSLLASVKRLFGDSAARRLLLGKAALEKKRYADAAAHFGAAARLEPGSSQPLFYLGLAHAEQGRDAEALEHYARCLALGGRSANLLNNLAVSHARLGNALEAQRHYEAALALDAQHGAAAAGLGRLAHERGDFARAIALYDQAMRAGDAPYAAAYHKSQILLARGELREGFKCFSGRPNRVFSADPERGRLHAGALPARLGGKVVLVLSERTGIGDDLFFARYFRELKARGARVAFRCGARSAALLKGCADLDELLEDGAAREGASDYAVLAGDLPYALQLLSMDAVPAPLALRPAEQDLARARELLQQAGPRPFIGLTWKAGTEAGALPPAEWQPNFKAIAPEVLLPVLEGLGGTLFSVQRSGGAAGVTDLSPHVGDLPLTLAILWLLDEYICVPNTHMHMRLSAGRPCRILDPFPPDWRLEAEGRASRWYPGARIYRQKPDGDWQAALAELGADLQPALADAHGRAGAEALERARTLQTAAMSRRENPGHAPLRAYDEALGHFTSAARLRPGNAQAHRWCAIVHRERGELEQARASLAEARCLDPRDPDIAADYAAALEAAGEVATAIALFEEALREHPHHAGLHGGLALALLGGADFERGWEEYEWRLRAPDASTARAFPFPRWEGEPLAGRTLLVTSEQGVGDEVMFASLFPELLAAAGHCVLEASTRLVPLFERSFPGATVLTRRLGEMPDWSKLPRIDYCIAAGSVPRLRRRSRADFPVHGGYLVADAARVAAWRERLAAAGGGRKIGLAWTGGLPGTLRASRSLGLEGLRPLLAGRGDVFVALEFLDCTQEVQAFNAAGAERVHWWPEAVATLEETAAVACALDLVISVPTATAHLAAALGRPTWVLIAGAATWRYLWQGERMPWYPSMRLFRGEGDREAVVRAARVALDANRIG